MAKFSLALYRLKEGTLIVDALEGKIYSTLGSYGRPPKSPIELKQWKNNSGYMVVSICRRIKGKEVRQGALVHRVIWMAINGNVPIPKGYEIDHRDRNPLNNTGTNLRLLDTYINKTRSTDPFDDEPGDMELENDLPYVDLDTPVEGVPF
jgi:hypothetical protein